MVDDVTGPMRDESLLVMADSDSSVTSQQSNIEKCSNRATDDAHNISW